MSEGTTVVTESQVVVETPTAYTPQVITEQYRRAVAGCLEMVRFGAMLMEVETNLTREIRQGCIQYGESLKEWIEANCPEVKYQTAMRFKVLAVGVHHNCKLPTRMPLALAVPAPGGGFVPPPEGCKFAEQKIAQAQKNVWNFLEGKSARQLLFGFGKDEELSLGGAREGAGRPRIPLSQLRAVLEADPEYWRRELVPHIDAIRQAVLDKDAFGALPDRDIEALVVALSDVCKRGREVITARKRNQIGRTSK